MQDRLSDLQKGYDHNHGQEESYEQEKPELVQYRSSISRIYADIQRFRQLGNSVQVLTENVSTSGIEKINAEANSLVVIIQQQLEKVGRNLEAMTNLNSTEFQACRNEFEKISQNFLNALREYNNLQGIHKKKCLTSFMEQVKIAIPNITEVELTSYINSNESESIFASRIIEDRRREEAIVKLKNAKDQKEELKAIEASIKAISELFIQMQTLLEEQGERLDVISKKISATVCTVSAAVVLTSETLELRNDTRKKKAAMATAGCCVCCGTMLCCGLCEAEKLGALAAPFAACSVM